MRCVEREEGAKSNLYLQKDLCVLSVVETRVKVTLDVDYLLSNDESVLLLVK